MANVETLGNFRSQATELGQLKDFRYENIFRVYNTDDENQYYFYNIFNKVSFDEDAELDPDVYYERIIQKKQAWSIISSKEYGTMDLWWLLLAVNNIQNPLLFPPPGTKLKVIKPEYLRQVIDNIKQQLDA